MDSGQPTTMTPRSRSNTRITVCRERPASSATSRTVCACLSIGPSRGFQPFKPTTRCHERLESPSEARQWTFQRASHYQSEEILVSYFSALPLSAFRAARCLVLSIRSGTNLKVVAAHTFHQSKSSCHVLSKLYPHGGKQVGRLKDDSLVVVGSPRQPGHSWNLGNALVDLPLEGTPRRKENVILVKAVELSALCIRPRRNRRG